MITEEKSIDKVIEEKRHSLSELVVSLTIYMAGQHPPSVVSKVNELKDRLEFRTKQYESQLLEEKIKIYQECLDLIKK